MGTEGQENRDRRQSSVYFHVFILEKNLLLPEINPNWVKVPS